MNDIVFIGVDPGLTGGIAVLYPNRTEVMKMPLLNRHINVHLLVSWLTYPGIWVAHIEKVWAISRGKMAIASLNFSAGVIHGMLKSLDVPVYEVAPATWRKAVLGNYRAKKQDAIDFCCKNYPAVEINGDHNLAEALCIAHYGKITWKG